MRAPLRRAHSLPLPCAAHPAASARIPSSALHHTLRRAARIRSSFLCRAPLRKATHSLPFVRPALRISPRHAHSLRPPYAVTPPLRRAFPSSTLRRHLAASARIPSSALRRTPRRFGAHPFIRPTPYTSPRRTHSLVRLAPRIPPLRRASPSPALRCTHLAATPRSFPSIHHPYAAHPAAASAQARKIPRAASAARGIEVSAPTRIGAKDGAPRAWI